MVWWYPSENGPWTSATLQHFLSFSRHFTDIYSPAQCDCRFCNLCLLYKRSGTYRIAYTHTHLLRTRYHWILNFHTQNKSIRNGYAPNICIYIAATSISWHRSKWFFTCIKKICWQATFPSASDGDLAGFCFVLAEVHGKLRSREFLWAVKAFGACFVFGSSGCSYCKNGCTFVNRRW